MHVKATDKSSAGESPLHARLLLRLRHANGHAVALKSRDSSDKAVLVIFYESLSAVIGKVQATKLNSATAFHSFARSGIQQNLRCAERLPSNI